MKKYILNTYNLLLKRRVCTKKEADSQIFYFLEAPAHIGNIKEGEEFYAFIDWKLPQTNVFSEKDCVLRYGIKKQTDNPLVYLWWRIKYRKYQRNVREKRRRKKIARNRRK